MSKYEPLLQFFAKSDEVLITLSFAQVEEILGASLPPSAHRHPAWWANETSGTHTHSNSWMDVGYHTENLDRNSRTVSFRKVG